MKSVRRDSGPFVGLFLDYYIRTLQSFGGTADHPMNLNRAGRGKLVAVFVCYYDCPIKRCWFALVVDLVVNEATCSQGSA